MQLGAYAAKRFERGVPGLLVSGGLLVRVRREGARHLARPELGGPRGGILLYDEAPRVRMTSGQRARTGESTFRWEVLRRCRPPTGPSPTRIQKVHYLKVGPARHYAIGEHASNLFGYRRPPGSAGRNGHAMDYGITVGASWGFTLPASRRPQPPSPRAPRAPPRPLPRARRGRLADPVHLPAISEPRFVA